VLVFAVFILSVMLISIALDDYITVGVMLCQGLSALFFRRISVIISTAMAPPKKTKKSSKKPVKKAAKPVVAPQYSAPFAAWALPTKPVEPAKTAKTSTGRKCSICTHADVDKINSQIQGGQSLRSISLEIGISDVSVHRHTNNCLNLELKALIQEKKREQAINVYNEFAEQLEFAKRLRIAAEEYLAYPEDPLRLALIPRADEIEVVYYDYAEVEPGTKDKPKKKSATLAMLLLKLADIPGFENAEKVSIKHVDLRTFALNALNTADNCIDRFAQLGGEYQRPRENKQTTDKWEEAVKSLIENGHAANKDEAALLINAAGYQSTVQDLGGMAQ
jgi:hypothetical protein